MRTKIENLIMTSFTTMTTKLQYAQSKAYTTQALPLACAMQDWNCCLAYIYNKVYSTITSLSFRTSHSDKSKSKNLASTPPPTKIIYIL